MLLVPLDCYSPWAFVAKVCSWYNTYSGVSLICLGPEVLSGWLGHLSTLADPPQALPCTISRARWPAFVVESHHLFQDVPWEGSLYSYHSGTEAGSGLQTKPSGCLTTPFCPHSYYPMLAQNHSPLGVFLNLSVVYTRRHLSPKESPSSWGVERRESEHWGIFLFWLPFPLHLPHLFIMRWVLG